VEKIPRVRKGLGMVILSTPSGVMCDRDARQANVGGEVLCEVW
jgi:small subunit ribosomal protein S8